MVFWVVISCSFVGRYYVWEEHSTLKRDVPLKWEYPPTQLHDITTQPLSNHHRHLKYVPYQQKKKLSWKQWMVERNWQVYALEGGKAFLITRNACYFEVLNETWMFWEINILKHPLLYILCSLCLKGKMPTPYEHVISAESFTITHHHISMKFQ
jgi:hypothetical protein